jgi:hypothetical protein
MSSMVEWTLSLTCGNEHDWHLIKPLQAPKRPHRPMRPDICMKGFMAVAAPKLGVRSASRRGGLEY